MAGGFIGVGQAAFVLERATANFLVRSQDRRCPADVVAVAAESQRSHLYWHWREQQTPRDWKPRCEIVIHASRARYLAAVGREGETSLGSSWLDVRDGKCHGRRIDLLADSRGQLTALSHELTHVAVSDMLDGRMPARWLDEGIALLADPAEKQRLCERDLRDARARGLSFRTVELLGVDTYPVAARVPAFYAQSGSLAAFLVRNGKPSQLLEFAGSSLERGNDSALREVYGIDGVAALERAWHSQSAASISYSRARPQP